MYAVQGDNNFDSGHMDFYFTHTNGIRNARLLLYRSNLRGPPFYYVTGHGTILKKLILMYIRKTYKPTKFEFNMLNRHRDTN